MNHVDYLNFNRLRADFASKEAVKCETTTNAFTPDQKPARYRRLFSCSRHISIYCGFMGLRSPNRLDGTRGVADMANASESRW